MGTRADYYIKKEDQLIWLGSTAWDGYPDGIPEVLFNAKTEQEYLEKLNSLLTEHDGTRPSEGWPWPWDNSGTTDYSYIFVMDKVWASSWGGDLFDPLNILQDEDGEEITDPNAPKVIFQNMKDIKNVQWNSKKGGILIVGI